MAIKLLTVRCRQTLVECSHWHRLTPDGWIRTDFVAFPSFRSKVDLLLIIIYYYIQFYTLCYAPHFTEH